MAAKKKKYRKKKAGHIRASAKNNATRKVKQLKAKLLKQGFSAFEANSILKEGLKGPKIVYHSKNTVASGPWESGEAGS